MSSTGLAQHADLTWEPPVDVREMAEGVALDDDDVRVIAAPTDHRPVAPTIGYRIEHGGYSAVLAGDTVPCTGLDRLCTGADVLVHTAIRSDVLMNTGVARLPGCLQLPLVRRGSGRHRKRAGVVTLVRPIACQRLPQAMRELGAS
jgi:ribonuclease Z